MRQSLTDRHLEAKRVALAAAELPPAQREPYLAQACADDATLRREVQWMLGAIEATHTATLPLLRAGPVDLSGHDTQADHPRHYRLLRHLGEGGMGTVYLAERIADDFSQQVALKLLAPAAEGSPILAERFVQERRLLARLDHPGIARLLDGGVLADGRPFLAMEFVDGERIDAWCDRRQLDLAARIALFLKVCAAVEYAHRHLIIHRDIKPANILVTADGTPKLLDFGIARLIDDPDNLLATATATEAQAMTLAYASPEQVERLPLTVAADVYSLGVVLYQLVAGCRPYQHLTTPHLLSQAIVTGDVVAPSRALRERGDDRTTTRAQARRAVPRDLDAIVLKALRRRADDRYAGVVALAADLQRFVACRPVHARRGRTGYRVRRFIQRNRWPLAAGAAVVLAVCAGLAASLVSLHRARAAQQLAEQRQQQLERTVAFQQHTLETVDIDAMGHAIADARDAAATSDATDLARHALDTYVVTHALAQLDHDFADAPLLRADLRQSLAQVLVGIGSYEHAARELESVLATRQALAPADEVALMRVRLDLADVRLRRGDPAGADALYAAVLAQVGARRLDDPPRRRAEIGQARTWFAQGRLPQAQARQQALYDALRQRLPADDPDLLRLRRDLVATLIGMGLRDQALAQAEPLVALDRTTFGNEARETLDAMVTLAQLQHYRHNYEQSLALAREVAAIRLKRLGADHPDTLRAQYMVAMDEVYLAQDGPAFDRAGADLQRLIDARRRVLGPEHPDTIASMTLQVRLLAKRGNADGVDDAARHRFMVQAIALERQILAAHQQRLGEDHPDTLMAHGSLANLLSYDGQYDEAVREARRTLAGQQRVLGPEHPIVFATDNLLGDIEVAAGHWAAARAPYEQALAGRARLLGDGDAHTLETASRLYEVLGHLHDAPAALAIRQRYLAPIIASDPATLDASLLYQRRSALEVLKTGAAPHSP